MSGKSQNKTTRVGNSFRFSCVHVTKRQRIKTIRRYNVAFVVETTQTDFILTDGIDSMTF